jgi:hypothetical protein
VLDERAQQQECNSGIIIDLTCSIGPRRNPRKYDDVSAHHGSADDDDHHHLSPRRTRLEHTQHRTAGDRD